MQHSFFNNKIFMITIARNQNILSSSNIHGKSDKTTDTLFYHHFMGKHYKILVLVRCRNILIIDLPNKHPSRRFSPFNKFFHIKRMV